MATTLTVIVNSRTPDSVAIFLENDGVKDNPFPNSVARATLLAQLLPGPLKELLNRTADWTAFDFAGGGGAKEDFVRINLLAGGDATLYRWPSDALAVHFAADALEFGIWINGLDGGVHSNLLFELRAVHANER
jgi:hypothetical protein